MGVCHARLCWTCGSEHAREAEIEVLRHPRTDHFSRSLKGSGLYAREVTINDARGQGSPINHRSMEVEVEGDEIDIRKPGVFYLLRRLRLGGASKTRLNSWTTEEGCELSPLSTYGRGLGGGSLDVPFCTDVTLLRFPPPNKGQGLCHWQGYIPLPKENCTPRP